MKIGEIIEITIHNKEHNAIVVDMSNGCNGCKYIYIVVAIIGNFVTLVFSMSIMMSKTIRWSISHIQIQTLRSLLKR